MAIDLNAAPFNPVIGQDGAGIVTVAPDGFSVTLQGNLWKVFAYPIVIDASTELHADFVSVMPGEIQGIGVTNDITVISSRNVFQLAGSQTWGIQTYRNQTGPVVIPIGEHFTGAFTYLLFLNDHDVASPTSECTFANIDFKEQEKDDGLRDVLVQIRALAADALDAV